jgi:Tol biopolymer transport system component
MVNLRIKIISIILLLLTLVVLPTAVSAQSQSEMKKIFAKAESYYLFEEYELANQLYLLLDTTNNLNIKYKIGNCYLNIPGEKEKSIPYLEAAVKTSSYDSKTLTFKELRAPLDAYFSLAKAYLVNNQLEKALSTLETFSKLARETKAKGGMTNLDYIDQQIQACKNAIQYKANPVTFSKKTMGNDFNQGAINDNPAVSFDGNTIVYTERRGVVNAIFYSKKERGKWQTPIEITAQLNAGEDCSSSSLNSDGTELFLYKTDNYDGNIYSSNFLNGAWTPIKKLNKNINTKFYESHASISADGKKLYFTSNRDGGQGNLDIYVSEKDASGEWGPAVNMGAAINTPFNEDTPFITQNDSVLYFSSEGHSSMGGYDIFKSQKIGNVWKTPTNVGFPINTTDDDKFFQPVNRKIYSIWEWGALM